jgi:hypothetical protein
MQQCLIQFTSQLYNELASAVIDQERMMKAVAKIDEKRKKIMPRSVGSGVLAVLLPSTTWAPHLGVSCVDHNSSRIGAVTHSSNCGNSSSNSHNSNSNSSTMLLLHYNSTLPSGHHNSFPPPTFHASTVGRWATLLENATNPSKATQCEL